MLGEVLPYAEDARKAAAAIEAGAARPGAAVSAGALSRLADAHYDAGRRGEATRLYRLAVEKDPEHEWACYRLSVLLGKDGGEEYRKRIRKDQALVGWRTRHGRSWASMGVSGGTPADRIRDLNEAFSSFAATSGCLSGITTCCGRRCGI